MRTLSMIAMLLLTLSQAPAPQAPPSGVGGIQGTVEQASTKSGIADAQVTVTSQPAINRSAPAQQQGVLPVQQVVATLQTDASGHFELKNLAAGTYVFQAQREGYLGGGANQFSGAARPIAIEAAMVTADQTSKVTLSMTRGSTISGRIVDSNGNSVPNITIAAYQKEYQDGKGVLLSILTKQSDDRGEYRLFWLNSGEYYIGVLPGEGAFGTRGGAVAGPSLSHPLFYPGVFDAKTATQIKVDEGADITGISISLQGTPSGVTVSGRVDNTLPNIQAGPRGQPPNLGALQFYLAALDPTALTLSNTATILNTAGSARGANTDFQISGVLPGSYDLIALVADDQGRPFPGRTRIDVGNQDVTGVSIPVRPGVEVKGNITVRGSGPAVSADLRRFQLRPADATLAFAVSASLNGSRGGRGGDFPQGTIKPDPSVFSYLNVPDGRYAFEVQLLKLNAYVEDIREGTRSIFDSGLTIENGKAPGEIQVFINPNGETVEGSVFDAVQKPAVAHAVLVPAPSRRQNASLYKTATSNAAGKFTLSGVAPGDYKLFAWEDVPNGAWQNAEFMTSYEVLGTTVRVAPGIRNDIQLRVIPAGK